MGNLCVCREYEDMFTEGYKYIESLEEHDAKVRQDAISKFTEWLEMIGYLNCIDIEYDWDEHGYQSIRGLTKDEVIDEYNECLKEKNNA